MADIPRPTGLNWVKLQEDMDKVMSRETTFERLIRKLKNNPLVPIGVVVTCGALGYGLYNFKKGRVEMQQKMMRLRVGAQFFTIMVALGGVLLSMPKGKRTLKDLQDLHKKGQNT